MGNENPHRSSPPLVLVVEDHDDSLLIINYTLAFLGCQVISQKNGSATLLVAKEYQPDLILLDIFLPCVSGLELLERLREESLTRGIPIVAVTALGGEEERDRLIKLGFDDYLSKPFRIEDLEAIVRNQAGVPLDNWTVNTLP